MPTDEPARTAEAVRRALPELVKLNRYESRAVARRDRALRADRQNEIGAAIADQETDAAPSMAIDAPEIRGERNLQK